MSLSSIQTSVTSYTAPTPLMTASFSRRYSSVPNSEIGNLLIRTLKTGTDGRQPTIVAIPLYIRNNLKYPSIFELLSTNALNPIENKSRKVLDIQSNTSNGINTSKQPIVDNSKQNEFISNYSQNYRSLSQKSLKYNLRDEQKIVRQRDDHKYDSDMKESSEYSSPQKNQWSPPLVESNNRYIPSKEITLLRSTSPQRQVYEEESKQSSSEYDSPLNGFQTNKFNDNQNNEQKTEEFPDYGSGESFKAKPEVNANRNYFRNYPFIGSSDGKVVHKNRVNDKSAYSSSQTSSNNWDDSDDSSYSKYSDTGSRDERYYSKNDNNNQNQDNSEYEAINKNNDFKYRSPVSYIRSYERPSHSNTIISTGNAYTSRPSGFRQSYGNNFVTSKPLTSTLSPISSEDDSSQSIPSNNYNSNFNPIVSSNSYTSNYQSIPQYNVPDSQISYIVNPSAHTSNVYIPENNSNNYMKSDSKSHLTSNSNPNYSTDYSVSDENDCIDDNPNDYKSSHSSHSSQSIKSLNTKTETDTKNNDRDYYESEDLDPSKLDLKIVHLPVSLLRRLIGSGDIGLPSYQ